MFASPVSAFLLRYASDAGFRMPARRAGRRPGGAPRWLASGVLGTVPDDIEGADVVVTDHHRDELGVMLRDALATKARWIGVHRQPASRLARTSRRSGPSASPPGDIARVHRPIGLNIGSRTPPEIAISTLAGLLADRNSRPGGFDF